VLQHDNLDEHDELKSLSRLFENFQKETALRRGTQKRKVMIATGGNEVQMSSAIIRMQTGGASLPSMYAQVRDERKNGTASCILTPTHSQKPRMGRPPASNLPLSPWPFGNDNPAKFSLRIYISKISLT
jgi:hypothetical protein